MTFLSDGEKVCRTCGNTRPLSDYYRNARYRDGYTSRCRHCTNAHQNRYRRENPGCRDGERGKPRRASRNPPDPQRAHARTQVKRAVARGDIMRPEQCCICHKTCTPEGHHYDYDRPLAVLWLCTKCHKQQHAGRLFY